MSQKPAERSSARHAAHRAGRVLMVVGAIIALNLMIRLLPLEAIELPSIAVDLPDVPNWLQWLNRGKNWALGALVVFALVGQLWDEVRKDMARERAERDGDATKVDLTK